MAPAHLRFDVGSVSVDFRSVLPPCQRLRSRSHARNDPNCLRWSHDAGRATILDERGNETNAGKGAPAPLHEQPN